MIGVKQVKISVSVSIIATYLMLSDGITFESFKDKRLSCVESNDTIKNGVVSSQDHSIFFVFSNNKSFIEMNIPSLCLFI